MDQARSAISKIFNGEPHSYTRFNLTQNMEGENSQVEMKLSSDIDEELGGPGVGEHLNHNRESSVNKPRRTPKNFCFIVITILLIFIIGYLIGYLAHRRKNQESASCLYSSLLTDEDEKRVSFETGAAPLMDWDMVKTLLEKKLSTNNFETRISEFSSNSHKAGSPGDELLGNEVLKRFKEYGMDTWTDEHFVKLQDPPVSRSNTVLLNGEVVGNPEGYLAYSANGKAEGSIVYAYYGRMEDLQEFDFPLNEKVILVRAGKISFAEKIANAAKMNAVAVLIYPDPDDYQIGENTDLFGHVHLGSGDPYTPGFPSFNHTQFPPAKSSGLPSIIAQTISAKIATAIMKKMGGREAPRRWKEGSLTGVSYRLGDDSNNVTVEVNNVLAEKKIHNVFGVIKGFVDIDRYVVIGAQRDAWGQGFARSTVGTALIVELARVISDMVKNDGFKPRRSIVFASWSGGEYGSVGATEWLEGYLSSLNMKAFSYINLDGTITGFSFSSNSGSFKASASPLLYKLIRNMLTEVKMVSDSKRSLYDQFSTTNWETAVMEPMTLDNPAYPFFAFSGIPSVSFRYTTRQNGGVYPYFGTMLDTRERLNTATSSKVPQLMVSVAQIAGQMALRLVHDHLLLLDVEKYNSIIRTHVGKINRKVNSLQSSGRMPKNITVQWLISASGSYSRASKLLLNDIKNSNLDVVEICRRINDRIMKVEKDLLSPYVSPIDSPFRHVLGGTGSHTLQALIDHLENITADQEVNMDLFRNQLALATWTIQGCANELAGNVWDLDNEI